MATKKELTAKVISTYSMQYLLDRGSIPSQEKVVEWHQKLEGFSEMELLELAADMDKCGKILR